MKILEITVPPEADGAKVDVAIVKSGTELSRRQIRRILDRGGISIAGRTVRFASRTVSVGDKVRLEWKEDQAQNSARAPGAKKHGKKLGAMAPPLNEDTILFDDQDLIIINKPPQLASQPTRNPKTPYAEAAVRDLLVRLGSPPSGILLCHRLDLETSGVLVFARSKKACDAVMRQFKERRVAKIYHALSAIQADATSSEKWTVNNHLSPISKRDGLVRAVNAGGKPSQTSFHLLAKAKKAPVALIECRPKTGRTHQIRVHLEGVGLPILGDKKYGEARIQLPKKIAEHTADHHLLHARELRIEHPSSGEMITVEADYPPDFAAIVDLL